MLNQIQLQPFEREISNLKVIVTCTCESRMSRETIGNALDQVLADIDRGAGFGGYPAVIAAHQGVAAFVAYELKDSQDSDLGIKQSLKASVQKDCAGVQMLSRTISISAS